MIRRRRVRASAGITIDPRAARRQEPLLVLSEHEAGFGGPRLGQLEPAAGEQEAGVGAGREPVGASRFDPPAGQQVVAGLVDPALEARPLAEQRLVGDLDRRCPRGRITVEREQAVAPVLVEHRLQVVGTDARLLQLGPAYAAAGVLVVLGHVDEAKEHAVRGISSALVEPGVDRLGPSPDGAGETAGLLERRERDPVGLTAGEQLDHRVLDEREGAGLQLGVGGDPINERRLDLDTHASGREAESPRRVRRSSSPRAPRRAP